MNLQRFGQGVMVTRVTAGVKGWGEWILDLERSLRGCGSGWEQGDPAPRSASGTSAGRTAATCREREPCANAGFWGETLSFPSVVSSMFSLKDFEMSVWSRSQRSGLLRKTETWDRE